MADELKQVNQNIKDLAATIKQSYDKIGSRVGKEINDIMTPELQAVKDVFSDGIGATKDSGKALLNFFGAGLDGDARSLKAAEETADQSDSQTELLRGTTKVTGRGLKIFSKPLLMMEKWIEKQYEIMKWDQKRKLGMFRKGKRGWLDYLLDMIGLPLFVLGAAVGAVAALIVKPFWIMYKSLKALANVMTFWQGGKIWRTFFGKKGLIIRGIVGLFKHIFSLKNAMRLGRLLKIDTSFFGKFIWRLLRPFFNLAQWGKASAIGKTVGAFGKFFSFLGRIGKILFKGIGALFRMPFLRMGLRGFLWGFKKLFFPIQIILSTIDFIKGFMETEGTIYEKIKGGIKNVIVKFFEWPLEMLGKLWDWVLTKLGLEKYITKGGSAAKLVEWLGKGVDMVFEGWELIFGLLGDLLRPLTDAIGNFIKNTDWKGMITTIVDAFAAVWAIPGKIKQWILDKLGIEPATAKELWEEQRAGRRDFSKEEEAKIKQYTNALVKRNRAMAREKAARAKGDEEEALKWRKVLAALEDQHPGIIPAQNNQEQQPQQIPISPDPETGHGNYGYYGDGF